MARAWRIEFEDAVYHVTSRGNNKQDIFLDDEDRGFFLNCLARACKRFDLEIPAFCLMNNHYHLFLRTPNANLSKAMQWLNGTYTGHFNWRHNRSGHLFQGRYHSVLITDEIHYLQLSMYIHLNPVRAGLVEGPDEYYWSSYRDYIGSRPRFAWLRMDEVLDRYGASRPAQRRLYRRECLSLIGAVPGFAERLKTAAILGTREKIAELQDRYKPSGNVKDVTSYSQAGRKCTDPEQALKQVAEFYKVYPRQIKKRAWRFLPRQAAFYYLVECCGIRTSDTAEIMGVDLRAVSAAVRKVSDLPG